MSIPFLNQTGPDLKYKTGRMVVYKLSYWLWFNGLQTLDFHLFPLKFETRNGRAR